MPENNIKYMSEIADQFKIPNNNKLHKKKYPTGFNELDKILNGGFTAGLHCLGAQSNVGKSTFAIQIADHMATNNTPVLMFNFEMKAIDITAKNISRQTYIDTNDENLAKTSDMLMNKNISQKNTTTDWEIIKNAAQKISDRNKKTIIIECDSIPFDVDTIEKKVNEFLEKYNEIPFIIIDYLQILNPPQHIKYGTDKQIIDYNIKKLKLISNDKGIPILAISSFNRENYSNKVSFKSFKESGNIEYSCDTVIGMQYKNIGTKNFENPRDIELVVLKQRYGQNGQQINLKFYSKFGYFCEKTDDKSTVSNEKKQILRF